VLHGQLCPTRTRCVEWWTVPNHTRAGSKLHRLTQQINRQKGQPHTHTHTHSLTLLVHWSPERRHQRSEGFACVGSRLVPVGDWSLCERELATARGSCGNVCSQVVADAMLQLGACARMRFKGARQTQVCGSLTRAGSGRGASGAAGCTTRSANYPVLSLDLHSSNVK
jgi:hypothetical protein